MQSYIYEAYAHTGGKTNGAGERANAGVLLYSSLSTYSVWVLHVYQVQMLADSSLHTAVTFHASGQWHNFTHYLPWIDELNLDIIYPCIHNIATDILLQA